MNSPFAAYNSSQGTEREESERLSSLWEYKILDSSPERSFDELAEAAAKSCGTPYALITFVDKDRQWFKAKIGIDLQETGREDSFCQFCIQNAGHILEIPDTREYEEFKENPLVTGCPYIRFYAGAPIQVKNGHFVGTVCVLDQRPRTLSSEQRRILQILADRACDEMENRLALLDQEKRQQQETSRKVLESEIEERQRIGQELHDGVVQSLAAARMQLTMAMDEERSQEERKMALARLGRIIDQASDEIRGVGHSLMGKKVREKGFQNALKGLVHDYDGVEGVPVIEVRLQPFDEELDEIEALNLFRVAQEFVHNSIKHASASRISIQAGMKRKQFWMLLEDDGKGLDSDTVISKGGSGNMEYRIHSLGGQCEWNSTPGQGFSLKITLDRRWKESLEAYAFYPNDEHNMGSA